MLENRNLEWCPPLKSELFRESWRLKVRVRGREMERVKKAIT
jgi:hypothetical protein